jgi:EmrB/QacA subfamily drug resistance transporter
VNGVAPRRWQVLTFICVGVFLGAIDFYIVSVAVPDMLRSFPRTGIANISWVFNGYTVTFTAALLPAGGLADRFGRRRVFLAGLGIFSLSALVCAAAPSADVLIAARLVQGVGGGTITPIALALILPQFPAQRRGTAIGLWSATQSAAVAAGPAIGGVLVSAVGWRAVFLLQLPIGLAALGGTAWALADDRPGGAARALPDLAGVAMLGAAIGLPSLAIVESHAWGTLNWRTDLAFATGAGLGVAFVLRTMRHPVPVIDLGLLKIRAVRHANGAMLLTGLVMFALPVASVLFLTGPWGYSEARAGLAITPGPLAQAIAALSGGKLCNRLGPRTVAVPGALLLSAATLTLALATGPHSRYWAVVFPAMLASSAAVGLLVTSLSSAVVSQVPAAQLASGTSLSVTARAAGAVVSLSALALVLAAARGGTRTPVAFHTAWAAMAVVAAMLVVATGTLRIPAERPGPATAAGAAAPG